ncbi:MAG: hypothetical protein WD872_16495 [Pirellulaceae bacterium]
MAVGSVLAQEDQSGQSAEQQQRDPEVRLQYNDEENRLSIDVDDEIQFRGNTPEKRGWTGNEDLELRYDRERNTVTGNVEGALRLDKVGSDIARWWQSWWDQERQSRRSRGEGAERGALEFIRQHDDNRDGFLSKNELPQRVRDEFDRVDRNDDDYLSRSELRNYGDEMYDARRTSSSQRSNSQRSIASNASRQDQSDQTWSEWWSSWWSDEENSLDPAQGATSGTRQFVRQHDKNIDGYVSQAEVPQRMRGDFARLDGNDDGYLSSTEIRQRGSASFASRSRATDRRSASRSSTNRNQNEQTWSQWWSSWWSEESDSSSDAGQIVAAGAREFIRRHDQNDDGYLMRSELPSRMYDEFTRIDQDDDRYLTRSEVQQYASQTRRSSSSASRNTAGRGQSESSARMSSSQSSPAEVVYVWMIDANQGQMELSEVQEAYALLAKFDADSDGEISQSELNERREQVVSNWCDQCFDKLDKNGDDTLTRTEAGGSVIAERFDHFDQNGNDSLTKEEVKSSVEERFAARSQGAIADENEDSRR